MLTANDIGCGVVNYLGARRTSSGAFSQAITDKSRPRKGDLLITKDGTLGRVAIHDGTEACINQSVALLRFRGECVDVDFALVVLQASAYQARMIFEAGGTAIKHIYVSRLAKMAIALPPLPEQTEIACFVAKQTIKLDALIVKVQEAIERLKEYRTALISAAVTGKIDVRNL